MAKCEYCSTQHSIVYHGGSCPRVKSIEYYPNGTVKRVEFVTPNDYAAPIQPQPYAPVNPGWPGINPYPYQLQPTWISTTTGTSCVNTKRMDLILT